MFTKPRISKIPYDVLANLAPQCDTLAEMAEKLGYSRTSGTSTRLGKHLKKLNIDLSRIESYRPGRELLGLQRKLLQDYKPRKTRKGRTIAHRARIHLIQERGSKCEICGLTEWRGLPISLQIHHIDHTKDPLDLDNIAILCPNCHTQTDNFCGKAKLTKLEK